MLHTLTCRILGSTADFPLQPSSVSPAASPGGANPALGSGHDIAFAGSLRALLGGEVISHYNNTFLCKLNIQALKGLAATKSLGMFVLSV